MAWDYLEAMAAGRTEIQLSPQSSGVTGLETYVWAPIPDPIDGTLTSPFGTSLQAQGVG